METYMSNGIKYGVENGRRFRFDEEELCLAQTHPESGIRHGGDILFADGSYREGCGVVHHPPQSGGQYPRQLPVRIRNYWTIKFERAVKEFRDYKRGIHEGYYQKSKEVLKELKRLRAVAKGAAAEIKKAERAVEIADPSYREKTEADRRIEAANQRRKYEFLQEVKSIELDV